ncbi:type II secretion system protein [Kribbella antibiotica]|uniref:Type II secretion system protein n=1 Tax=Kribbella antibiotica TaxID=190195 RepID=A0A4R4YFC9_9ACTN|nr:type II secretion system F family protein [Kribbella antibiotica]TDD43376.1 type II secretion system protein [Kribbella antibiotica]
MSRFLATLCVLLALHLWFPLPLHALRRLTPPRAATPTRPYTRRLLLLPPAAIVLLAFGPQVFFAVGALAVIALLALLQREQHRRQAVTTARRTTVIEALDVLAADLAAGRPPIDALGGAATITPDLQPAHLAAKLGGDVPAALELAAQSPGSAGLRALAATWRVAEESGAAFATLTERLADSLRADEAIHRQTAAGLAGARSSARILAALPLFGTALGYSLGANPLGFLTATPSGWICLTAGLALTAAGLHWTTRLATETPCL